jgi:hypothetical protein
MRKIVPILVLLAVPAVLMAATIHVPADQPTIQAGIDASTSGDTVLVSPGTYTEHLAYPSHQVRVQSVSGAGQTTLHGWVIIEESDSGSALQGFTISGMTGYDLIYAGNETIRYFEIRNNVIANNNMQDIVRGGDDASLIIERNVFVESAINGNVAVATGSNCRFVNNTVYGGWRGLAIYGANAVIENNIVVNVSNYAIWNPHPTSVVDYNDFWNNGSNNSPGLHGFSANPLFFNPGNLNFSLQPASPCIDTGDPNPAYNDPDGTRNDMGALVFLLTPQATNINFGPEADGDTVHTRFPAINWSYVGPLPQQQFQIQVGTDSLWDVAEMWDSGPVASSGTSAIYAGLPLSNHSSFWARVRVRDAFRWGAWAQAPLVVKMTLVEVPEHYAAIQAAINDAADNDTILVSDGHYYERLNLLSKSLLISSEILLDGDTSHIANTIIDADTSVIGASDTGSVIYAWYESSEDRETEFRGLTVQHGVGGAAGCVKVRLCDLKFVQCAILDNDGVAEVGPVTWLTFDTCSIWGCPAGIHGSYHHSSCSFNECTVHSIPIKAEVCDFYVIGSHLVDCDLSNDHYGLTRIVSSSLTGCSLRPMDESWLELDSSLVLNSEIVIVNGRNSFIRNSVVQGSIANRGMMVSGLLVENTTLVGDILLAARSKDDGDLRGVDITITNSLVVSTLPHILESSAPEFDVTARCSDIITADSVWVGSGSCASLDTSDVITLDPLFCDTAASDFRLSDLSPCLPENNGCGVLIGALGMGCTTGKPEVLDVNLGAEAQMHVLDHTPSIFWSYTDTLPTSQQMFEIEVGSDSDWAAAAMWAPGAETSPDTSITYAGAPLADGNQYFMRVRVNNGLRWGTWTESTFRMNSVPTPVELVNPVDEGVVEVNPPALTVLSLDSENDSLHYTIHVAVDSTFYFPLVVKGSGTSGDPTEFWLASALEENHRYWWRAKVADGYEERNWSNPGTFYINAYNEAPSGFSLVVPGSVAGGNVYLLGPQFVWHHPADPDPQDTLAYTLVVAIDSMLVFHTDTPGISDTSYTIDYDLQWNRDYWWKVKATDLDGAFSWSSEAFRIHTHPWICGDADGSGGDPAVDIDDVVLLINYIFASGTPPNPLAAGDVDCSGGAVPVDIDDVVYLINFIFAGGPEPCAECP